MRVHMHNMHACTTHVMRSLHGHNIVQCTTDGNTVVNINTRGTHRNQQAWTHNNPAHCTFLQQHSGHEKHPYRETGLAVHHSNARQDSSAATSCRTCRQIDKLHCLGSLWEIRVISGAHCIAQAASERMKMRMGKPAPRLQLPRG